VPFTRAAWEKLCVFVRFGFVLDFQATPGNVINSRRTIAATHCFCHSERTEESRIIITGHEQDGPEIFRFAQDDSVVGIVVPTLFTNATDVPRHARRDRRRTWRHRMHTSLLVSYRAANVMIDCGLDWLGKLKGVDPSAIVLTHAHQDHAWGLKRGAPCPVYAPEKTWQELQHYQIKDRHLINERTPTRIREITFEAFPVEHSILSPAVGYPVRAGRACLFYAPDLIFI